MPVCVYKWHEALNILLEHRKKFVLWLICETLPALRRTAELLFDLHSRSLITKHYYYTLNNNRLDLVASFVYK